MKNTLVLRSCPRPRASLGCSILLCSAATASCGADIKTTSSNFLQSLMPCSDWGSLTPARILRSASSPTSCCSSEQPAWVRLWWTRWRPLWRKLSTLTHGLTYRCSDFTNHYTVWSTLEPCTGLRGWSLKPGPRAVGPLRLQAPLQGSSQHIGCTCYSLWLWLF